jgi:hypothetical protein
MTPQEHAALLAAEQQKLPKLEILFGRWWRHYAPPAELAYTLFCERARCPYCDGPLGAFYTPQTDDAGPTRDSAHLEHMDPLARGGEDSIRNALYVCAGCNLKKRSRAFVDWLAMLDPVRQPLVRAIYVEKHGHTPEDFKPQQRTERTVDLIRSLTFDEAVLRQIFPKPIVSGPPAWR